MLYPIRFACLVFFASGLLLPYAHVVAKEPTSNRVAVNVDDKLGQLTVKVDGRTALVYCYGPSVDLPHFDPFNSPSGRAMTAKIADPYPHHRSFWVAEKYVQLKGHKERDGVYTAIYSGVEDKKQSRWPIAPYKRRSVHVEFSKIKANGDSAEFDEKLTWTNGDVRLLDELRHYRIRALGSGEYFLDFSFKLQASYGEVTITRDASHYGIPYIRMNDTFNVQRGGGKITNSTGGENQSGTHDKPATWIDYSAPLADKNGWEGLACFIHPSKKPPHLWLTRDYGTWGPRGPEGFHKTTFTVANGESYDQRVGLLIHNGDAKTGNVSERYQAYGKGDL